MCYEKSSTVFLIENVEQLTLFVVGMVGDVSCTKPLLVIKTRLGNTSLPLDPLEGWKCFLVIE